MQSSYSSYKNYLGGIVPNKPIFEPYRDQKEPQSQQQFNWPDNFLNNINTVGETSQEKPIELETSSDPKIWGPQYWYTLHMSAAHYPLNPSPIVKERMKQRILAIPYELPCSTCRPHASAFIESRRGLLDKIVSSRENLVRFYVDFHNQVNKRYGKPLWTYEQAVARYSGTKVNYIH